MTKLPELRHRIKQPVYWGQLMLDGYATLYIKEVNTRDQTLTYRICSPTGTLLEGPRQTVYIVAENTVLIGSATIPLDQFIRLYRLVHFYESGS